MPRLSVAAGRFFCAAAASFATIGSVSAIDATWNFNGDLSATSGSATMAFRGDMQANNAAFFKSEHDLGLPMPYGDHGGLLRFKATDPSQGLAINLHDGPSTISDYTMVWDVFRPGPSWQSWTPLYQTDAANSSDAEFFINPEDGIGINGQYDGAVANGRGNLSWNRLVLTRSASGTMKKYIDGRLVGVQTGLTDPRWNVTNGKFTILADDNGESSAGFLSSFRFIDRVLSDSAIADLGAAHAGGASTAGRQITADPAAVSPGSFTIVFLGDTQNYSSDHPAIFKKVTQWVVDNKAARNIQFLIQDGDIVNSDKTNQWDNARAAMDILNGEVPYAVVRGNHDIGSEFDYRTRFGPDSPYSQQATLVDRYATTDHPTWSNRNTVHKFTANGQKLMVLTLDISAESDVVDWASGIIAANRDYRVILDTHAYMYDGGERFNNALDPDNPGHTFDQSRDELLRTGVDGEAVYNGAEYGGQDAETLWNTLVSKHENVSFVFSGHQFEDYDQFKYHLETNDHGKNVYQMLTDPQHMANGGNGWIRLLEFDADGETVHVKTYSPHLDQWDRSADNYYDIQLSPLAEHSTAGSNSNDVSSTPGLKDRDVATFATTNAKSGRFNHTEHRKSNDRTIGPTETTSSGAGAAPNSLIYLVKDGDE